MTGKPTAADMAAFGASDEACYRWPEDTDEHKALRAAFIAGAAAERERYMTKLMPYMDEKIEDFGQ